jgi:hypothetical protein
MRARRDRGASEEERWDFTRFPDISIDFIVVYGNIFQ